MVEKEAENGWNTEGTSFIPCGKNVVTRGIDPYIDEPLARSEFDLPNGPLLRFEAYRKAWDKCLYRIKEIIYNLYSPVVEEVVDSVQAAYTEPGEGLILPFPELVTLVVASPDRTNLREAIARISSALCENQDQDSRNEIETDWIPTAFISQLSGIDCLNIIAAMKTLISKFVSQVVDNAPVTKLKSFSSPATYDVNILEAWYEHTKEKYDSSRPALVVLIHDVHAMDPSILRDVLEILSLHVPKLPLVVIVGSSDPELLHSVLPRSTLACLRLDKYVLPWNATALEHVMRETFFSLKFTPDVMLGPVGFETIFAEFNRHNATLDAVISTLQLFHIQHFYSPLSVFINPTSDATLRAVQGDLPEDWIPFFKLLRQYCLPHTLFDTSKEASIPKWTKMTPERAIQNFSEARSTFRSQMNKMKLVLRIIEVVLAFGRGHGKKTQAIPFDILGLKVLRGAVGADYIRDVSSIIKQSSLNEAAALLEELYHLLQNLPSNVRNHGADLKGKVVFAKNDIDEQKITDFVEIIENYFTSNLVPFDVIGLDVWWTGELGVPHSPLNPNPHVSIVTALLEPHEYLGWNLPADSRLERALSSLPDASILFRRYVESGRMINIYDWYDSFSVALEGEISDGDHDTMDVEESPSKDKVKRKARNELKRKRLEDRVDEGAKEIRSRELQARFMRSMHELEFVGFLKHTGRKVDHVMKTTFDVLD